MTYIVYGKNGTPRSYDSIVKARAYAVRTLKDGFKVPNIDIRNSSYMAIGTVGFDRDRDGSTVFFYSEYSTPTKEHRAFVLKSDGTLGKRLN